MVFGRLLCDPQMCRRSKRASTFPSSASGPAMTGRASELPSSYRAAIHRRGHSMKPWRAKCKARVLRRESVWSRENGNVFRQSSSRPPCPSQPRLSESLVSEGLAGAPGGTRRSSRRPAVATACEPRASATLQCPSPLRPVPACLARPIVVKTDARVAWCRGAVVAWWGLTRSVCGTGTASRAAPTETARAAAPGSASRRIARTARRDASTTTSGRIRSTPRECPTSRSR
jgi:hypothetical protein